MIDWNSLYEQAVKIATAAHQGQTRWDPDIPYITHPLAVADAFEMGPLKVIAIMHDVLEDSDVTEDELKKVFPSVIVDALVAMTHREAESYADYILRIKTNSLARQVKKADIQDNLKGLEDKRHKQRREKYELALRLLDPLPVEMDIRQWMKDQLTLDVDYLYDDPYGYCIYPFSDEDPELFENPETQIKKQHNLLTRIAGLLEMDLNTVIQKETTSFEQERIQKILSSQVENGS